MTRMLGWSLGVSISYEGDSDQQIFLNFQAFYCVRKKVFRVFVTSISSDINFSFFSKVIFFLYLFFSERNGFTVCQNFLLSVKFFSFSFAKYCFISFLRRDTQKFLCLVKVNLFSSVGFFKNLFLICALSMIDLNNTF